MIEDMKIFRTCESSNERKSLLAVCLLIFLILSISPVLGDTYSSVSDLFGVFADTGNTNTTGALNLTLQIGTCSLPDCSDAVWSPFFTNADYTSLANLTNSPYFKYKATFFTEDQNYTPYLFNVTIKTNINQIWGSGIYLNSSSNNNIVTSNNVTITGSGAHGFSSSSSTNSALTNNRFNTTSAVGVYVTGTTSSHYNQSIDTSNLAEGLPVNYTFNGQNLLYQNIASGTYGQVICAWCDNMTYNNFNMTADGFGFYNTSNSKINNSVVSTNKGYGVFAYGSNSTYLQNNTFNLLNITTTTNSYLYGIYLLTASGNNVTNCNVTTTGTNGYGIYSSSSSSNNFSNSNITTLGTTGHGIYFSSSSTNNLFDRTNIQTNNSNANAVYIHDANHNFTITNSVLNASYSRVADFYVENTVTGGLWNLTNVTFDKSDTSVLGSGNLNVFWYADTFVNDTAGNNVSGANVSVYDVSGSLINTSLTNASGLSPRLTLREYMQNATAKYFDTNLTFMGNVTGTNILANATSSVNLTLNRITDTNNPVVLTITLDNPPYWSLNSSDIYMTYVPLQSYFNITWIDDVSVSTVNFGSNISGTPANYSMNSLGSNIYNYSTILPAGTYYWRSWANDTQNQWNVTSQWIFTIAQATLSLTLSSNTSWVGVYPVSTNVSGSGCPSDLTCNLYRDNVLVSNPDIGNFGAGTYVYVYNTTGNQNYTSATTTNNLVISKNPSACDVLFDKTSPQVYPTTFTVYSNCDTSFVLYRNGTIISNNSLQSLGGGYYNFTVIRDDKSNYTNIYDEEYFTITPGSSEIALTFNGTRNDKTYTVNDLAEIKCDLLTPSNGSVYMWTNYSNGVMKIWNQGNSPILNNTNLTVLGWFVWTCNWSGNENYTSDSETFYMNVTNYSVDVENPIVSFGINPVNLSILNVNNPTFELKCSDNAAVDTLQLWTNITGTWALTATNSSPLNDTIWNAGVSNLSNGDYSWAVWCNDTSGNEDMTSNRTFTINYQPGGGGGTGGGVNNCANYGGTCWQVGCPSEYSIIPGSSCYTGSVCCMQNNLNFACQSSLSFIKKNSMFSYTQNELDDFYNSLSPQANISIEELTDTIVNYNSKCGMYCIVFSFPGGRYLEALGRLILKEDPCTGGKIIIGLFIALIVFLIILFFVKRKKHKEDRYEYEPDD